MSKQRRSSGVSAPQQAPESVPVAEGADQLGNEAAKNLMLGLSEESDEELDVEIEAEAPQLDDGGPGDPDAPPDPADAAPPAEPAAPADPAAAGAPAAPPAPPGPPD